MMVPSPRSVTVDRRPELEKVDRRHQFLEAVKLKHLVMNRIGEVKRLHTVEVF